MEGSQNLRGGLHWASTTLMLPAVILPLALVGIAVRPALDVIEVRLEYARAERKLEAGLEQRATLERFGSLDRLEAMEVLRARLHDLIPEPFTPIEVYTWMRIAAERHGLDLRGIRMDGSIDLDLVVGDETVVMETVVVEGEGGAGALVGMVGEMRAHGLPTAVLEFSMSRASPSERLFRMDARVGVFHRAQTEDGGGAEGTGSE